MTSFLKNGNSVTSPSRALGVESFLSTSVVNRSNEKIRINFNNRALSLFVADEEDLDISTPDKTYIKTVAQILSDMQLVKTSAMSFDSISELVGIDYVGYIVDKERLNNNGTWTHIDTYRFFGSVSNYFKDSRVIYDGFYRYRVASVVKVTVAYFQEDFEEAPLLENLDRFQESEIKEILENSVETLVIIKDMITKGLFSSKLANTPIVITLRPNAYLAVYEDRVEVVKTPPEGAVLDDMTYLKQLAAQGTWQESSIERTYYDLNDVVSGEELQKRTNEEIKRILEGTIKYKSYYFRSNYSDWSYTKVKDNKPPPPPSSISAIPITPERKIIVSWAIPAEKQRDISISKVYTKKVEFVGTEEGDIITQLRNLSKEVWSFVGLSENKNMFVHENVKSGYLYAYAVTAVDIHGLESFLSTQIGVYLNKNFVNEGIEKELLWLSGPGTRPDETIYFRKFIDLELPEVAKKSVSLEAIDSFSETDKQLVIRVTSLDTHERKDFRVNIKNVEKSKP